MIRSSLYYLFILSLSQCIHAFPGWPGGGTIVAGNAVQFDRDVWEANLAHPNATGRNPITGFDVSKRFPSPRVDGWFLTINVTSDIPDSQTLNPSNATGKTYTGTSIALLAPPNLRSIFSAENAIDETTWKICIVVIPNAPQANISASDDGTCSIGSGTCVPDLEKAYAEKFARGQDCYGTPPVTPESCGGTVNTGGFNVQQLPLASITGKAIFATASTAHAPGDDATADAQLMMMTWPVLAIWGWNARADVTGDEEQLRPTVQLSCIRARDVVATGPGTAQPQPSASTGSRVGVGGVAWFVAVCGVLNWV